jgi:hypothetical protein
MNNDGRIYLNIKSTRNKEKKDDFSVEEFVLIINEYF